jgi:putative membrane protein
MRVRSVVILVLLLLFLVVVVQNTEVVSVRLLFWDLSMSRILLLALSLAIGVIVGFLLGRPWRRQQQYARAKRPPESEG